MLMKVKHFEESLPLTTPLAGMRKGFLMRTVEWLEAYAAHRSQRRDLLSLNDHLLKDIGLSRSDAQNIASKPFRRRLFS